MLRLKFSRRQIIAIYAVVGIITILLPLTNFQKNNNYPSDTKIIKEENKILFVGDFDKNPWTEKMHPQLSDGNSNFDIINDSTNKSGSFLRAFYKKGSYASHESPAGTSATIFNIWFDNRGINIGNQEDLYFRYKVRFMPDFSFNKSGKLPGLGGGENNAGGNPPNGYDGWTGRIIWKEDTLENYMYIPSAKKYGIEMPWLKDGVNTRIMPGRWECIEMHYKLNQPNKQDGIIEGWFNGEKMAFANNIVFRKTEKLKIENIHFSTFFGGASEDYQSPKDQYADFDDLALSNSYIGCD